MKITTMTIHRAGYRDVEKAAAEHYGINYSFPATQECGNDTSHQFRVGAGDLEEEDEAEVRAGKVPMYNNGALLEVLCKDGHIPAGDYVIEVFW